MGLKRDEWWWIEGEDGRLINVGRERGPFGLADTGCPNLQPAKYKAKRLCRNGETPVRVKMVLRLRG